MATNPLIPLMAEVPKTDLFDSFLQGVDYKDSREDRARAKELQPMQDRLLKLQTDAAEQNLETTGIANEAAISQQQLQQALQGYDHATNLLQIQDTMERARVLQAFEQQMGIDDGVPDYLSDEALRSKAVALQSIAQRFQAQKPNKLQFGSQQTFKDEQGNLFLGTLQNDPSTGESTPNIVPLPGSPETPVGKLSGANNAFTETATEKTDRVLLEEQGKADISVEAQIDKLRGEEKEARISDVINNGIAASDVIPTYKRMTELLDVVSTGGIQEALQRSKQIFGQEAADLGELDVLFKEAVLANIKKMGANPTEGERKFLLESSGSIGQNTAVLKRIVSRRMRSAEKDVDLARKFAGKRDDVDAIEIIDSALAPPVAPNVIRYDAQGNRIQ